MSDIEEKIFKKVTFMQELNYVLQYDKTHQQKIKGEMIELLELIEKFTQTKTESTLVVQSIYEILIQLNNKVRFKHIFRSNYVSLICHTNISRCYQNNRDIANSFNAICNSVEEFEEFFAKVPSDAIKYGLKVKSVYTILQKAAFFSNSKNHDDSLVASAQAVRCLGEMRREILRSLESVAKHTSQLKEQKVANLRAILEVLDQRLVNLVGVMNGDKEVEVNTNRNRFIYWHQNQDQNKRDFTNARTLLKKEIRPMRSSLLAGFSIKNAMTINTLSTKDLEPSPLRSLSELKEYLVEFVLLTAVTQFSVASELNQIGINRVDQSMQENREMNHRYINEIEKYQKLKEDQDYRKR